MLRLLLSYSKVTFTGSIASVAILYLIVKRCQAILLYQKRYTFLSTGVQRKITFEQVLKTKIQQEMVVPDGPGGAKDKEV